MGRYRLVHMTPEDQVQRTYEKDKAVAITWVRPLVTTKLLLTCLGKCHLQFCLCIC